jgi:hypothetical protein
MIIVTFTGCEDESDMALNKVAAPVLMEMEDTAPDEIRAVFYELDKSGILDHTVGIDSIPVSNLSIEVFAAETSIGVFTTDASGSFSVTYADARPNEFAGVHKGTAFRIKK